jgi:hypothetical protein
MKNLRIFLLGSGQGESLTFVLPLGKLDVHL